MSEAHRAFLEATKVGGDFTDTLLHYTAQVVAIFCKLDKDIRHFDPSAIVQDDIISEHEGERILAQVALSLAELTRELLDEKRSAGKPEVLRDGCRPLRHREGALHVSADIVACRPETYAMTGEHVRDGALAHFRWQLKCI